MLDSGPLGLLVQRSGVAQADVCREWILQRLRTGARIMVPEIVVYELRRELLRLQHAMALSRLDSFLAAAPDRLLLLNTSSLRHAAELWAKLRQQGLPTAAADALDIDVILSAQALGAGYSISEFVVATSNVGHLIRLVPASIWSDLE